MLRYFATGVLTGAGLFLLLVAGGLWFGYLSRAHTICSSPYISAVANGCSTVSLLTGADLLLAVVGAAFTVIGWFSSRTDRQ